MSDTTGIELVIGGTKVLIPLVTVSAVIAFGHKVWTVLKSKEVKTNDALDAAKLPTRTMTLEAECVEIKRQLVDLKEAAEALVPISARCAALEDSNRALDLSLHAAEKEMGALSGRLAEIEAEKERSIAQRRRLPNELAAVRTRMLAQEAQTAAWLQLAQQRAVEASQTRMALEQLSKDGGVCDRRGAETQRELDRVRVRVENIGEDISGLTERLRALSGDKWRALRSDKP